MTFKRTTLLAVACTFVSVAYADEIGDYHLSDGTRMQPHERNQPNNNPYDNWSTKKNINPYTGKRGTKNQ